MVSSRIDPEIRVGNGLKFFYPDKPLRAHTLDFQYRQPSINWERSERQWIAIIPEGISV